MSDGEGIGGFMAQSDPAVRISKGMIGAMAVLMGLGGGVAGAVLWVVSSVAHVQTETAKLVHNSNVEIGKQLAVLTTDMAAIRYRLDTLQNSSDDRWRKSEMRSLWREFAALNPTLKCPEID